MVSKKGGRISPGILIIWLYEGTSGLEERTPDLQEPKPRGSEYPNSTVLGPQIHTLNGFWTLKPYYLGTSVDDINPALPIVRNVPQFP